MADLFPAKLVPQSVLFTIEHVSRSGGISTNGGEQFVGSMAGRWKATIGGLSIRSNDGVLEWRALMARLRGRAGTVLVPVFDGKRAPWPVDPYGRVLHPGFVRRQALDETIYADPEIPAPSAIVASFLAGAARRATTVQIGVTQGAAIRRGQYVSPSAGRLHVISDVIATDTFRIEPPLRDAVVAGQAADFVRPTCEMRLAADDAGALDLQLARFGSVGVDFVEAV